MAHEHAADPADFFTQEFWDERYGAADRVWSGRPNQRLVEQVAELAPGRALDLGSGEGADAIWLASRGWQVTGVDLSTVALRRAAEQAAVAGEEVAARITWQQADLFSWVPPQREFDLVAAHFIQPPQPARGTLHRRLAAGVRPGGALLIVGHHPSDMHTSIPRPRAPELFFTAEEIVALLDPEEWEIVFAGAPDREAVDPDGQTVAIRDAVLHARRRRD